jgi:hypothetical protein
MFFSSFLAGIRTDINGGSDSIWPGSENLLIFLNSEIFIRKLISMKASMPVIIYW